MTPDRTEKFTRNIPKVQELTAAYISALRDAGISLPEVIAALTVSLGLCIQVHAGDKVIILNAVCKKLNLVAFGEHK